MCCNDGRITWYSQCTEAKKQKTKLQTGQHHFRTSLEMYFALVILSLWNQTTLTDTANQRPVGYVCLILLFV